MVHSTGKGKMANEFRSENHEQASNISFSPTVDTLAILDQLEKTRREHLIKGNSSMDYPLRVASAIVANAAGLKSREIWTTLLKQDPKSNYAKDYNNPEYPNSVW